MNILEQLQSVNITKPEIETLLDNAKWTVEQYDKMVKSFEDALNAFETLKDNKIVDLGSVDTATIEKTYEEYKAEFTEKCELLRTTVEKLELLKEIL